MLCVVPCTVGCEGYFILLLLQNDSLWVFQPHRVSSWTKTERNRNIFLNVLFMSMGVLIHFLTWLKIAQILQSVWMRIQ